MKTKPLRVFIDQYSQVFRAKNVKDLQHKLGGRVSKMYVDKKDGSTVHIGYVVGKLWLTEYQVVERKA